jgi:hypothetical protein
VRVASTWRSPAKVAVEDVTGDGIPDVVVAESKTLSVIVLPGKGGRAFDAPVSQKISGSPASGSTIAMGLSIDDLNGDGIPDISVSSQTLRSISVLLGKGAGKFRAATSYGMGLAVISHRAADMDGDGALDLVGFSSTSPSAMILLGRAVVPPPETFRRGDANADGQIVLSDPIVILTALFLGGEPVPCEDAADADDDGAILLNDPILILFSLFMGGGPLPAPGPACGPDPTADTLACGAACSG